MHQEETKEIIKINQHVNGKGRKKKSNKNKHLKKAKNDQQIYDLINRARHPSKRPIAQTRGGKGHKEQTTALESAHTCSAVPR